MDFTNKVGSFSEEANHHADIQLSYGRVIVKLETHEEARVIDKDVNLAQLVDDIK
ncbi:4a-hydroxytetrahydrobiopterin dehydratase [Aerococcaceae bacterium WGS1372]